MDSGKHTRERRLLMGCGSVGGVLAGGLLRGGRELSIVTNNETITRAIDTFGLRVTTPRGEWSTAAHAVTSPQQLRGTYDTVLLAMKATEVQQAVRDVAPLLSPKGCVVTLQNGVVEDAVGEILGRERVIGGLVGWGATMIAPGQYHMTSWGETIIGELDGQISRRIEKLQTSLEAALPTTVSGNIYGVLWSKLAINCTITTLGAITGQYLGEMLNQRRVRRLALAITSEVVDVAKAHNIVLEPVGGTLDIERLYLPQGRRSKGFGWDVFVRQIIMFAVGLRFRRLKSSMLQSLERGRRTEIDFMNAYVVERGREAGIQTPVNAALTRMVRDIEAGRLTIHPQNLAELM